MPLHLEIGPGRGDFLFALAAEDPNSQFLAVEYKPKRFEKLLARTLKRKLSNIAFFCGDARKILPAHISDASVDTLYILFSDPWPKRRHAPHRLFRPDFLEEIYRILKDGGEIYIAHDDPKYLEEIKTLFQKNIRRFQDRGPWDIRTMTFYGEKWLREGRTLDFFHYRKIDVVDRGDDVGLSAPCVQPIDPTFQAD